VTPEIRTADFWSQFALFPCQTFEGHITRYSEPVEKLTLNKQLILIGLRGTKSFIYSLKHQNTSILQYYFFEKSVFVVGGHCMHLESPI